MKKLFFIPLVLGLLVTACNSDNDPADNSTSKVSKTISLTSEQQLRVAQDNAFALDLLKQTIAVSGEQNVIVSPLSVSIALGMARNGAQGATKTEMEAALKMNGLSESTINSYYKIMQNSLPIIDPSTKMSIANSIWYDNQFPIKQSFLNTSNTYFNAYIKSLDFTQLSSIDSINNWCAQKTNNLIPTIIDNIPGASVMYLINAIYFKGTWSKQFDAAKTFETQFTNELNQAIAINMMNRKDTFPYLKNELAQYIDLPYGNKAYSMTVILPQDGKTTTDVLNALNPTQFNTIVNSLTEQEVNLYLPRFKNGCKYELKSELQNMGMNKAFDSESADFKGISDLDLYISRVIHKTQVEVTETGTEAAAVTAIEMVTTSLPMYETMYINKPFIFLIRENSTGVILFAAKMGHIEKY